ncbi:unnamed protein product [Ectocarpus sp. 12 AP-2014]
MGKNHSSTYFFNRTPIFGLRHCTNASVGDFVDVLRAFIDAGANNDHVDIFGNTLLLMSELDNLGAALVEVGACISYDWQDYSKRGLANAAIYGCPRTIDAIVLFRSNGPNKIRQEDFDACLDQAAKTMAYNPLMEDMGGIAKLVLDYGANPNKWNTLHNCVRSNSVLVATLVLLGASADTLAWDFYRGLENTPLHRLTDMITVDVLDALISPTTDINIRDGAGQTPLMALMRSRGLLHSDHDVMRRFNWLMERGASCLPVDDQGERVSSMARSLASPFKEIIAAKIRDENWRKRREMVLVRALFCKRSGVRKSGHEPSFLHKVADVHIDGVFRNIVTFL